MTDFGLSPAVLSALRQVFAQSPCVESVKIFGSRAKGSYHDRSDIDLVAYGENLDRFTIAALLQSLDDTNIPYQIDLQDYQGLKNSKLIDHIDRVGVEVYRRGKSDNASN